MKQGYARVSEYSVFIPGKIRKMRCKCTHSNLYKSMFNKNGKQIISFFNHGETGHPSDRCPICKTYIWFNI